MITFTASARGAGVHQPAVRAFHMLGNLFIKWTETCVHGRID